jgi:hypothetical protein
VYIYNPFLSTMHITCLLFFLTMVFNKYLIS